MIKVFLSHASLDKSVVELVKKRLGPQAWYDDIDIENGENIPAKINEGLRNATHFILFWSKNAKESKWVNAELNAAFVKTMAGKQKFMIFKLDTENLPELLVPYKYNDVNKDDQISASEYIVEMILKQDIKENRISEFVNRTKEIGDIEESVRAGYKIIILHGILGIGKSSLALKALKWIYPNTASQCIVVDFGRIPGVAELSLELSRLTKKTFICQNTTSKEQKKNIQFFLEYISESNIPLILKDVKAWLDENGCFSENMLFIVKLIMKEKMFNQAVIMTTSRYIEFDIKYHQYIRPIPIKGMDDSHIANIISNNLTATFNEDKNKNKEFATRLYGYPLGAKLGAYRIAQNGYDYYLKQPQTITRLNVSLAKDLISYAELSDECMEFLKIVVLSKSRLTNQEYTEAFPEYINTVAHLSDEAFFAGILKFDEDGAYKLELLVENYIYDLAFNDSNKKRNLDALEYFLTNKIKSLNDKDPNNRSDLMRFIPIAVHILTLNGKIDVAISLRSELTATIESSMWDQYNHREYDDVKITAKKLIDIDNNNSEALYLQALCLTRDDEYKEAEDILRKLLVNDSENEARYYYALGRIEKRQEKYNKAIELFKIATIKKKKYLSPYREMAECYLYLDNINEAKKSINKAKFIDNSNIFVILLEARLLQKENELDNAINLLNRQSILEREPDQIYFRKGRIYDQKGDIENAKICYKKAIEHNPKAYDAKLCLLNHLIMEDNSENKSEIFKLEQVLRGKRKYILVNIKARFVGRDDDSLEDALSILSEVPEKYKDRQWYAVNMQLLGNVITYLHEKEKYLLEEEYCKEYKKIKSIYGEDLKDTDFLPDA